MMIFRKFKTRMNWIKLAIALSLMCLMFSFGAMAQGNSNQPLDEDAASALVQELEAGLPDLVNDENLVTEIAEKWAARKDLAGKTRAQILNLLFADVKSIVSDREMQNQIWESWKQVGVNNDANSEEKPSPAAKEPAPKPESNPVPDPASGWKQPKFRFEVEYSDSTSNFKLNVEEIPGVVAEEQSPIEYKSEVAVPPIHRRWEKIEEFLRENMNITLKKVISAGDEFWNWYNQTKSNPSQYKGTMTIKLLNEDGNPTTVWTLKDAWVKVDGDGKSINSIVITYRGVTVKNN